MRQDTRKCKQIASVVFRVKSCKTAEYIFLSAMAEETNSQAAPEQEAPHKL